MAVRIGMKSGGSIKMICSGKFQVDGTNNSYWAVVGNSRPVFLKPNLLILP